MAMKTVDGPTLKLLGPVMVEECFLTCILLPIKSYGLPEKAKYPARLWRERIGIEGAYPVW